MAIAEHWRWRRRWESGGRTCSFKLELAAELLLLRTHSPVKGHAVANGPSGWRRQAAKMYEPLGAADADDQTLSALA